MTSFFDNAVAAHSAWKIRFRTEMKSGGKLDVNTIKVDDKCDLGRWLYGDGQRYRELREFGTLLNSHKNFHRCAADVAADINIGRFQAAEVKINSGEFHSCSRDVVAAIMTLKKHVRD